MTIVLFLYSNILKMKKAAPLFILFAFAFNLASAQYTWTNVGSGMSAPVNSLAADTTNHILYAGGIFNQAGGLPAVGIAKWDGVSWAPLGSGIVNGTTISSLFFDGTALYAGGTFTNIGGTLSKNIARWDGTSWSALGAGLENSGIASVDAITVYNNELYAAGIFSNSGGSPLNFIAKWDGNNWLPVGTGTNGRVLSLCVYNNELYAGGTFTDAGGVPVKNIARWNGATWSDVGGGVFYTGATTVSTMKSFASELYVGGTFSDAGTTSVNNLAKWNGATWSDVGGGTQYTGATTVSTMLNFNNSLIVAGSFDSLGTTPSGNIGSWNGSSWSTLGSGTDNSVLALESLGDTLYAGGIFTSAESTLTPFIAEWVPLSNTAISTSANEMEFPPVRVYPNPVYDHLYIKSNTEILDKHTVYNFALYDLLGSKVYEKFNVKEEIQFDRSIVPQGLYIYRITDNKNTRYKQGKLSFK
jgi:hypothetical protein